MNDWKQNEAFKKMDIKKQQMIEKLSNSLKGKQLPEAINIVTDWKAQLKKDNISFSKQEEQILTEIFLQELSPAQKKQYEMLKPLMQKFMH